MYLFQVTLSTQTAQMTTTGKLTCVDKKNLLIVKQKKDVTLHTVGHECDYTISTSYNIFYVIKCFNLFYEAFTLSLFILL